MIHPVTVNASKNHHQAPRFTTFVPNAIITSLNQFFSVRASPGFIIWLVRSKHRLSELWMIFSGYLNIADGLIKLRLLFCLFRVKGCRMCWKSTKSPKGLLQHCAAFSASISSKLYFLKAGILEKIVYMQRWRLCVPRGSDILCTTSSWPTPPSEAKELA